MSTSAWDSYRATSDDPATALWRSLPAGPDGPLRSVLARAYRERLGADWRDYYEGPYVDDEADEWDDEATEWETYCSYCAGIVALDAERCPHCGTADFDPVEDDE